MTSIRQIIARTGAWIRDQRAPLFCLLLGQLTYVGLLILWNFSLLQGLEIMAYDQALRGQTLALPDKRIVLIGETEADIQRWGYPLPDNVMAEMLERLAQGQPRVIGVDKYRDIPVSPGTEQLDHVLRNHREIVWIMKFGNAATQTPPINPPPALMNTDQVGFNDVPIDKDSRVRRGLLFLDDGQHASTAFALVIALRYLQPEGIFPQPDPRQPEYMRLGAITIAPLAESIGGYVGIDAAGYQYLMDFRGRLSARQTYTVTDVMQDRIPTAQLTDKIILIGGMAESLRDDFHIPVQRFIADATSWWTPAGDTNGRIAGVALHALQVNQLLRFALDGDKPIHGLPEHVEQAWLWLWCMTGIGLALCRLRFRWLLLLMSGALALLIGFWQVAFLEQIWLPLVAPALGLASTAALSNVYLSVYERAERKLLMHLFSRHVAPEVAATLWRERQQLLEGGRLRSQRLIATVLFTDIQGFTTISETMEPARLMDWLNVYMEAMTEVVMTHGGVVNKYIGDAVMALFGVPTPRQTETEIAADATRAVECALAMGQRLQQLNPEWAQKGLPSIAMRAGIHTGPLVAGSLGGSRRLEYTVLGDTVNIASRLESFEKDNHHTAGSACRVLIGESTFHYLNRWFQTVEVSKVKLKGKQQEITVYRVDGIAPTEMPTPNYASAANARRPDSTPRG
ncbi:MAG: adenylate/guanylate cyclase domain-containing protein [Candidatus Competibacteraceae bacterium]|nr:adenylate/guanylate cyclase domain-containing protein [Candidatus Competibacteraceae bacterium]MCP5125739.1 adenylate/guanylate cyclase domain-containing protein [Gammaproteobacteria bacterium]HRX71718.1 adenylate/guanylate cyclase domain-containing protein [Candidatus Competibacteraceae bacterium]